MIGYNFIFNLTIFCVIVSFFLPKLPTLGILFSIAVRAVVIAKLVRLCILFLTTFILALSKALVAKLVISSILSSIFFYLSIICIFYLTTSFFNTSPSLLKSTGTGPNLQTSNLFTLLLKLLKLVGTFFNLSASNLSTLF